MTMKETYLSMGIGEKTYEFCEKIEQDLKERFCEIDKVAEQNQMKVLGAMQKNHVSEACFAATTGYGYNDMGRETLEQVYADTFHTEAALVLSTDYMWNTCACACTFCKSSSRR